jgi:hypothetical protein
MPNVRGNRPGEGEGRTEGLGRAMEGCNPGFTTAQI